MCVGEAETVEDLARRCDFENYLLGPAEALMPGQLIKIVTDLSGTSASAELGRLLLCLGS